MVLRKTYFRKSNTFLEVNEDNIVKQEHYIGLCVIYDSVVYFYTYQIYN